MKSLMLNIKGKSILYRFPCNTFTFRWFAISTANDTGNPIPTKFSHMLKLSTVVVVIAWLYSTPTPVNNKFLKIH